MTATTTEKLEERSARAIFAAVDEAFEEQIGVTREFVSIPSVRGAEAPAQDFIGGELRSRGYVVDDWCASGEDLAGLPDLGVLPPEFSPVRTVVGTLHPQDHEGRSLILQGHCDIVPAGPGDMWHTAPFIPEVKDGWLHGRGAADMKSGTIAALFAIDAVRRAGYDLTGRLHLQSVVEEESTGVGALAALQRGYRADCALLPEPTGQAFGDICLGVIWFRLKIRGEPSHVASAQEGFNAIKAAAEMIKAFEVLEVEWNARAGSHPIYGSVRHPLNFNPGIIHGGDWASSVPAWCDLDCRIGLLPDWDVAACQREILACVHDAAEKIPFLRRTPPRVEWCGYLSHGYVMRQAPDIKELLEQVHAATTSRPFQRRVATSLNDSRFYDRHFGIPAFCYGPVGERIHGFNERVNLQSLRETTKAIALFAARWCGIRNASDAAHTGLETSDMKQVDKG